VQALWNGDGGSGGVSEEIGSVVDDESILVGLGRSSTR
jgi:hypothetical protein